MADITKERWSRFNAYEKYLHICSDISRAFHFEKSNTAISRLSLERALYLIELTLEEGTDDVYMYLYMHDRIAEVYAGINPSLEKLYKSL